MAEDSDLEKTEQATPQRLEKAREEGDVPRSRELATFTGLLAAGSGIWLSGDHLVRQLETILVSGMSFERAQAFDFAMIYSRLGKNLSDLLLAFAPLAGLLIAVAILSPALIGGWLFTTKALVPKFTRMNPVKGLSNLVSTHALVELIKAIGKSALVGGVAWMVIMHEENAVFSLSGESIHESTTHLGALLWFAFISMTGALGLIVLIDAPYQMWNYAKKLKMTREEVRQESKESEGDPQVKARIRAQQREMARRRMMAEVPTADVVVTNPTHYAVALKYADGAMGAPIVWRKALMKLPQRFASWLPSIASLLWKRRHWHVRCIATPNWAPRSRKRCIPLSPRFWLMCSSSALIVSAAALPRAFRAISKYRLNLTH
jgi:Flagellar biosynthesis pathway, component FlhB